MGPVFHGMCSYREMFVDQCFTHGQVLDMHEIINMRMVGDAWQAIEREDEEAKARANN